MAHSNTTPCHSSETINAVEKTTDTLTGRAGLSLFVRYLRGVGTLPQLEGLFGSLRKSRKGQPVGEIFKQLFCFFVDALFRRGDKHSNHGNDAVKSLTALIGKIRRHYRGDVPIIIRADSGFFDQKIMQTLEQLQVGYIIAGKLYEEIPEMVSSLDWQSYKNRDQEWLYVEFGDRRGNWKKFRRVIFCRPLYDELQRWLEFARPDSILYTHMGCGRAIDRQLIEAGQKHWLCAEAILEGYHQRGSDELVHRALKDFASQTLPFRRFPANAAFYYIQLLSFFLCESFKIDVSDSGLPAACYPTTFRRRMVDIAGKIVRHAGKIILKVTAAVWDQLNIEELWSRSGDPPRLVWA